MIDFALPFVAIRLVAAIDVNGKGCAMAKYPWEIIPDFWRDRGGLPGALCWPSKWRCNDKNLTLAERGSYTCGGGALGSATSQKVSAPESPRFGGFCIGLTSPYPLGYYQIWCQTRANGTHI